MRNDTYPEGTAQALLQTGFVLPQTKTVLQNRLDTPAVTLPSFFTQEEFETLQAVCKRLLPQPEERKNKIDLAGILDTNFSKGKAGNGWRYDDMPADEKAFHLGMQAINESAQSLYGKAFHNLPEANQDELLSSVQNKKIQGKIWETLPAGLFFTELMGLLAEIYYSHPFGRDEIGDVSYADAKAWHHIQLNEKEQQEPEINSKEN